MQQIDHRVIKLVVGLIAVFMASFMQLMAGEPLASISDSYHHSARDWFVGLLFAIAALFLSFSGENRFERTLTLAASFLAAVVAIAPCTCGGVTTAVSALHFPASACLFAILGYFCWRFRKTAKLKVNRYPQARIRVHVYELCFAGMVISWVMAAVYFAAPTAINAAFPAYVFWLEALGLVSFGFSWLAASRVLPVITNRRERFRLHSSQAPDDFELNAPKR